ncbi:hypothetical protein MPTK1_4g02870 [Marchantia polymorpha subsp. ruderalis]|uniref:DUF6817 domain-containing protein n=2 Tax=Marchantia polymorpha TaxID=3197 RepID=A0AAF6B5N6_MARPO|nr:hypothetical protein MARPO_0080s0012 [Marchantia polymorpha]PTQ34384.1 hypothetical protein MARPO_0080s0012 [Marchantia polymorpha]BBN07320.1 hypothetical protein Mp_4g02870 [Marchantia polymorpha subsp. ruderalis]BBN07321.1 hypothetical protein Mp_4g02870 [Marchantia polymorpha subsp. ruderalis]|eukprot:PTQ34383.1 hypothetical protein MARPO_0080s0012 [Marchantia polymorpha]
MGIHENGKTPHENGKVSYDARLEYARLFIRDSLEEIDPELPGFLRKLQDVGASECWHKHGTFYEHLFNVYRNLKLWNAADAVARCGLFHSAYSNSYVNLAIFAPNTDRQVVRDLIGPEAEELVHWFCIVPRQQVVFDMLLFKFTDEQLLQRLKDVRESSDLATSQPLVPPGGFTVSNIRTGEDLQVPRNLIAIFLILTMADAIDQYYGWQDDLFDNRDGESSFSGDQWTALWPGDGRPGRWASSISRMGVLLNILLHEEAAYKEREEREGRGEAWKSRLFAGIPVAVPPIFESCTVIVSPADQVEAVRLYWQAFPLDAKGKPQSAATLKPLLRQVSQLNPHFAEPHVALTQVLLGEGEYEEAEKEIAQGLKLLMEWGTQWDKRMSWEGWISWARVLQLNAKQKTWTRSAWGINSLGMVN